MSGHRLDPILKLVGYCHDFLRGARSQAKGLLHLRRGAARRGYLDIATLVSEEMLLFGEAGELVVRPLQQVGVGTPLNDIGTEFEDVESADSSIEKASSGSRIDRNEEESHFDVLRRLYGLVQASPHELECVYGGLFLEGSDARGKPVLAPLVVAPVSIRYDSEKDAIRIECEHDYARLNTYAISELFSDSYDAMEETLLELAQLPLPLDPSLMQKVLRTLQTVGGLVEVPTEILSEPLRLRVLERQTPVIDFLSPGRLHLRRYAALAVVRRGNVFVLDDLAQMAKLSPEAFEGSLLARFALAEESFEDDGQERENLLLGKGEILFPFAANARQLEAAHAIESHGLIRVQGPPGTGKSQTIANLVCHLVARGKRVLVASQQQKAIEVVQENYLGKLGIDFLPMTLLKGDREATRTLKSRLDGLTAFTFNRTAQSLRNQGQAAERKVAERRQRMLDLEAELGLSLVFEGTPWGATGKKPGELAAEYAAIREQDQMPDAESISWGQQFEVIKLLEQAVEITRELKGRRLNLAQLCESTKLPDDNEIVELLHDVLTIRDALVEEAKLCPRAEAVEVEKLPLFPVHADCTPEKVELLKEMLARQNQKLTSLGTKENSGMTLTTLTNHDQAACHADLESLEMFVGALPELLKLEEDAAGCGDGGVEPLQLAERLELYELGKTRWWSVLLPSFRKSRRTVMTALGRKGLSRSTDISSVRARVEAHRLRMRLYEIRARRLSHIPVPEIPANLDVATERSVITLCSVVKDALRAREGACNLSSALATTVGSEVSPDKLIDYNRVNEINEQISQVQKTLQAKRAAQRALNLVHKWNLSLLGGHLQDIANAVDEGDPAKAQHLSSYLESRLPLVSRYRALVALLEGPLASWRSSAEAWVRRGEELAANFHEEITTQVRARALRTELSAAELAAPRESTLVAEESRTAEEQYREAARHTVEANLHAQILEAYTKPAIGNEVRYFARILQKGKRNYEAFLKLKRSPKTFEAVLSVLPCWLATIQDVARVFPLRSHLFDIVIIDEASQCSIPSALPLFLRSQKAIVVGDDKQLPCVEGKFVGRAYNAELINRHYLYDSLPRPESFNACESSLFDLAGSFTEKPIFLAEHFRCHPDIIAFSNKRFYDERLTILTHGMDESLGVPTEVVLVNGASDDPQSKVNYKEADAVVRKLRDLVSDPRYEGLDFGVCSPFRNQTDFIWERILKEFTDKEIQDRRLISATADGFQGDERDVILYSFRFAPNSSPRIFTLADGVEGQQRMNVAITRPRRRAICFVSHSLENFPPGLVRDFLRHAANPGAAVLDGEPWDSQFERDVHAFLEAKGLKVRPQVRACGYKLDFVLSGVDGRIAALEADGWDVHYHDGRLRDEDIQRQRVLERARWTVFRVHSRAFYRDPERALAHVLDYFAVGSDAVGEGEASVRADDFSKLSQDAESEVQGTVSTVDWERILPTTIPLDKIQEALRLVAPEPGVEVQREDLYRRALPHIGLQRLGTRIRVRLQSAINGLIRRGEFGYRGRDIVWRLRATLVPSGDDDPSATEENPTEGPPSEPSFNAPAPPPSPDESPQSSFGWDSRATVDDQKDSGAPPTEQAPRTPGLFPPELAANKNELGSLAEKREDDVTSVSRIKALTWYDLYNWTTQLGYFKKSERDLIYRVARQIGYHAKIATADARQAKKLYQKAMWLGFVPKN